jgi:hypothetical protein
MGYIKISLLPYELKRQSSIMRRWTLVALILTVIAIAFFMVSYLFGVYLRGPINELQGLKEENDIMTNRISRLSYIEEMFDTIEHNNVIIKRLKGNNVDWKFTYDLTTNNITLYNITVKQISIDSKASGVNGLIVAEGATIADIIAWADATRNLKDIDSVELVNLTKNTKNKEKSSFYFEANIVISKWNEE